MAERDVDILVYGASGFTGRQAARYLAHRAVGEDLRIAIAGRDLAKLERVRAECGDAVVAVLRADAGDRRALDAIVARTRIVLNTAGPFARYGDAIVEACVRARTHYVDITGETPWMRALIDRHHERAAADGTRIVPACGFDSVPSDLGAYLAARMLRDELRTAAREVQAFAALSGGLNGGTAATMLALADDPLAAARVKELFLLNPTIERNAEVIARSSDVRAVRFDPAVGAWTGPFVMAPINSRVVRRSAALFAAWGDAYGPTFAYRERAIYRGRRGRLVAFGVTFALAAIDAAIRHRIGRDVLRRLLPQPGRGPSATTMRRGWFRYEFIGTGADGRTVRAVLRDRGDPANAVTVKCVCEAALALAVDFAQLPGGPTRGGVLTPATAFGETLIRRLRAAGMTIECVQ